MATGAGSARQKPEPRETPNPSQTPQQLDQKICIRAHEIWLSHNGQNRSAEADWLQAEEEILNEMN